MTTPNTIPTTPANSLRAAGQILLGIDLTGLSAKPSAHQRARQGTGQRVSLGDVSDYLHLAAQAGADLVTVGESFRLDDAVRPDAWLDPAVLVSRLAAADLLPGGVRIVPALPAGFIDPSRLARAVAGLQVRTGGHAGWQVPTSTTAGGVHSEVRRVWRGERQLTASGLGAPLLVTAPTDPATAVVAGRHSDVVRLRVTDLEEARARREAIRTAAQAAGRSAQDVAVVLDVVTIIGEDTTSARFRADLLRDLAAGDGDAPTLTLAGTAQEVADELARWSEVVDGFVLVPGSLPTDVVAIAHGLVPELRELGLVGARGAAAEPADVAGPATAGGQVPAGALTF